MATAVTAGEANIMDTDPTDTVAMGTIMVVVPGAIPGLGLVLELPLFGDCSGSLELCSIKLFGRPRFVARPLRFREVGSSSSFWLLRIDKRLRSI